MKLNNKGFAVSIILYSMIAVITIVLLLVLSIYSTNIHNKLTQAERIKEKLSNLNTLTNKVLGSNTVQTGNLRLNRDSSYDNSRGLYKSIVTNSGKPVYFFRGNVTNNYVEFAGMLWRIVRINEDKTVKIVLDTSIGPNKYYNSSVTHNYPASSYYDGSTYGTYPVRHDIYYSNLSNSQEIKKLLDNFYNSSILSNYSNKVVSGDYFCEQNKVTYSSVTSTGSRPFRYNNYTANFRCMTDGNGYGIVNSGVGLLSYDEVLLAGAYYGRSNNSYYLFRGKTGNNNYNWWTMSPSYSNYLWVVSSDGSITLYPNTQTNIYVRPVIVLRSDVTVSTGNGSSSEPYVIE